MKARMIPLISILSVCLSFGATPARTEPAPSAAAAAQDDAKGYKPLKGIAFHFCSCDVPCPCMFAADEPDSCRIVRVFHITEGGNIGPAAIGTTIVLVPLQSKKSGDTKKDADLELAVYYSEDLTTDKIRELRGQFDDLDIWIFGWSKADLRPAKITFEKTETGGFRVNIPGIFEASTESVPGNDDKPITAQNLPLPEGSLWFIGKAAKQTYHDPKMSDQHWDLAGKNGSWTFFETHYVERN